MPFYNALIRTHHITSRKKVTALRRAAGAHHCFVLVRYGGAPGIMYVEGGDKADVESWVTVVRRLRYKDFELVAKPALVCREQATCDRQQRAQKHCSSDAEESADAGLVEVETVKEFGLLMERRGLWGWWRKAMGYAGGN